MLSIEARGDYADVMERALYNLVAGFMAADGTRFFYVNPLEVWPEASARNPFRHHVKPARQRWFACACCPPNVARLLMSLGRYVYTVLDDVVYTHLYVESDATLPVEDLPLRISQRTDYPWNGAVRMDIEADGSRSLGIAVRIPAWSRKTVLRLNDAPVRLDGCLRDGYAILRAPWKTGDRIDISFDMPVELIEAHPSVRADSGRVAIQRGPMIYCIEEVDNGANLAALSVPSDANLRPVFDNSFFGGVMSIVGVAERRSSAGWDGLLYRPEGRERKATRTNLKAVPYCAWGNRAPGEMSVWIRRS
jgi:hypothetical protein